MIGQRSNSLLILIALTTILSGLTTGICEAQAGPICIKKMPSPGDPPVRLNSSLTLAAMQKKWGIDAWWKITTPYKNTYAEYHAGNGMSIALMSPEMIEALTNQAAQKGHLSGEEAEILYVQNLKKYSKDRIVFMGYLQIDQFAYSSGDVIDDEWSYTLISEIGKQYKPRTVEYKPFQSHELNDMGASVMRKQVALLFDNLDPDTGQPILGPNTPSLTVEITGKNGQVAARFEFDRKQKRSR